MRQPQETPKFSFQSLLLYCKFDSYWLIQLKILLFKINAQMVLHQLHENPNIINIMIEYGEIQIDVR